GGDQGQNDVAAIYEVVSRRFRRYLEEQERSGALDLGAADPPAATGDDPDGVDEDPTGPDGTNARQAEPGSEPTAGGPEEDDDAGGTSRAEPGSRPTARGPHEDDDAGVTARADPSVRLLAGARAGGGIPAGIDPETG